MDCFTKVIDYKTFIEFTVPEQRYNFLFNRAVISWETLANRNDIDRNNVMISNAIKWCEENCDEFVVIDIDSPNYTVTFFFRDHDDLLKFKLGFDDTIKTNTAGSR